MPVESGNPYNATVELFDPTLSRIGVGIEREKDRKRETDRERAIDRKQSGLI